MYPGDSVAWCGDDRRCAACWVESGLKSSGSNAYHNPFGVLREWWSDRMEWSSGRALLHLVFDDAVLYYLWNVSIRVTR